jgi:hypothetical protein
MLSSLDNMSIEDIKRLFLLRKEQDRKAEEEKKRKEKEDQDRKEKERRDRELVEAEAELAKVAKELEEQMEEEPDRAGDADMTPKARRDLFGNLEGEEDREEATDCEPDETSDDPKEKEWVLSHKEVKRTEIHLATARDNLTTAMYAQKTFPGVETDKQLVE